MGKIGMTFSRPDLDAAPAEHFGKAKWLMIVSAPAECELVRNEALNGGAVARELAQRGCTDVIVRHVGPGAHDRLRDAGIRVWQADPDATGRGQLQLLAAGALARFEQDVGPEHGRHGCGHGHGGGHGHEHGGGHGHGGCTH